MSKELTLCTDIQTQWICIQKRTSGNKKHWFNRSTISYDRKSSIECLLGRTGMTWDEAKKYGWVCKKVKVEITVL